MQKFLIVNDDGIDSKLIFILKEKLEKYGHVFICVPDKERSASSHSIKYWKFKKENMQEVAKDVYTHTGSPADSVRYFTTFIDKPDIVFSGINNGLNAGEDILYSGTIGAASQAILERIPAVALSFHKDYDEKSIEALDYVIKYIMEKKNYSNKYILNFNFPKNYQSEFVIKMTRQDMGYDNDGLTDVGALVQGFISLTPLTLDRTDYSILKKLQV